MKELFQLLAKYELTPNSHYLLYCLDNNLDMTLPIGHSTEMHRLKLQGYLDENSNITPIAKTILVDLSKHYFVKTKEPKQVVLAEGFKDNVAKYRELFPSERTSGRALRNPINELEKKMLWFNQNYPQYDWETILKATSRYISSLDGDYKFCQCSTYFIRKMDNGSKNFISNLATWCENIMESDNDERDHPIMDFNRLA